MKMNRREFLRYGSAAALVATGACGSADSGPPLEPPPVAPPPPPSLEPRLPGSFLSFGTGVNGYNRQSARTRMGQSNATSLLRYAHEKGVTFFDLADVYGTHDFFSTAMEGVPREQYTILTKIWTASGQPPPYPSGGAFAEVDRFRRELDTDYLDICLLHLMTDNRWPDEKKRVMDELSELKQRGIVRQVGVSCHDFSAMQAASINPWVDVLLARVNHRGGSQFSMDGPAQDVVSVLRAARARGKAVIGMKLFANGQILGAEERTRSVRFILAEKVVDAVTIGMVNRAEVDDNLTRLAALRS
jgi:1-deoxyxylulose-5-phosphate synthase